VAIGAAHTADAVPGPRWPAVYTAARFGADPLGFFPALRERYGDVFRLSFPGFPAGVAVAQPDLVDAVFSDATTFPAGPANRMVFGFLDGDRALVCLDGQEHRDLRRVLGPLGSWSRRHSELVDAAFDEQVALWPLDRAISVLPRVAPVVLDLVMRSSLGVGAREQPELAGAIHAVARRARPLLPAPALRRNLGPLSPYGRFLQSRRRLVDLLQPLLERPPAGDHALAWLTDAGAEARSDQLFNLLMAGLETTTASTAWAFERLAAHPDLMLEARAGDPEYLDAVVRETLRLRPPFPHVWRMVAHDAELDGVPLRTGSVVMVAIAAVHVRPDLFDDPLSFRPDRHLGGGATRGLIPFGGGVRACLGATMARHITRAALAATLRRGPIEPADHPERAVQWGGSVLPLRGGRVRLLSAGTSRPSRRAARRA
jgi:cytochrome P450